MIQINVLLVHPGLSFKSKYDAKDTILEQFNLDLVVSGKKDSSYASRIETTREMLVIRNLDEELITEYDRSSPDKEAKSLKYHFFKNLETLTTHDIDLVLFTRGSNYYADGRVMDIICTSFGIPHMMENKEEYLGRML